MNATLRLGKAIFQRFLETDLMPPGVAQVQLMTGALTLLAAPGLLLPARFAVNYMQLAVAPDALARALIAHRLLFVTFTIIALGLVALVIWEGVFPDRRDARILGPLPIPGRVLIVARLGALAAVAAVFALGTNLVPTLTGSILWGAWPAAVHGVTCFALGWILVEVLLLTLSKLPFTCTPFAQAVEPRRRVARQSRQHRRAAYRSPTTSTSFLISIPFRSPSESADLTK